MSDNPSKVGLWAWGAALLVGGGALLFAWDRFGFGGDAPLAGGQGLVDQAIGASSTWTYSEESDPMTDELTVKAYRQIEADGFFIETTVACQAAEGVLTYSFTTFDPDGFPVEFKQELGGTTMNIVPYHSAHFRPDAGTPQVVNYNQPRYTNLFELQVPTISADAPAYMRQDRAFMAYVAELAQLASAQQLTVRLPLTRGEPVIQIDQTDEVVAGVLGQCAQAASLVAAEPQPAEKSRPNEAQNPTFTITESSLRTSSLSRDGTGVEHIANLCIRGEVAIKNDTSQDIRLFATLYQSDDHSELGTAAAGEVFRYRDPGAGDIVIISPEHPTLRFRYRVADCG